MASRYLMVLHGKRENPIHHAQQDHDLGEIETFALVEGGHAGPRRSA